MKTVSRLVALLAAGTSLFCLAVRAAEVDPLLTADSAVQPGVPKGEILHFTFSNSKVFPGTSRDYWIYVPAQYKADTSACLFVGQDGIQANAPTVFDNLISKGQMPVTIGVFSKPGIVPSRDKEAALDRFNRSFEYDGLGEAYAKFLIDELLPEVETKTTTDGRAIHISHSPNDRAIGGESSGAIAAFTVAWERTDSFRRVYSAIGTFVGLRGGDRYPILIRKTEPKPIRVFLQDGSNDHNLYGGDWWMANQTMERALQFAGYTVNHVWGEGGHNGKQSAEVFPDAMRFLWKDWPKPITAGTTGNAMMNDILIPGEEWHLVGEGYKGTDGTAVNVQGEVFFNDRANNRTYKISLDGQVSVFLADSHKGSGEIFGPDGRLFSVSAPNAELTAFSPDGKAASIATGIVHGNDVAIGHNGNIYVTDDPPASDPNAPSKVWLIRPNGQKQVVDTGLKFANGIALSPDQSLLYVDDYHSHWVYSYQIQADGSLDFKQRYDWLHEKDTEDDSGADGLRVDRDGRLYVTTHLGIQVCDQAGRVNCIIPTPN
jgi:gluconolactonase